MVLPMFLLLAMAVFLVQLVFCFCAKKLWIKLLPVGLAGVSSLICWGMYFLGSFSEIYGGDFAAVIYGIVMLVITGIAGISWGIFALVKLVQNRRK